MKINISFTLLLCLVLNTVLKAQDSSAVKLKDSTLSTITVTSQRKPVERKADRTIINVDAFISNTGSNALEVLEKSPGVQVDNNETISLKGKAGVVIYIDDKPTYLSGADLAGYLKSLPASMLDKIEIMTTPPAKYDAAGNAGVINIKTKKSRVKGFDGNFILSHRQGIYADTRTTLNFNYCRNKLNFFSNLVFSEGQNFNDLTIEREYYTAAGSPLSSFDQNSFIKRWYKSYTGRVGMDYSVNKKATIGVMFTGVYRPSVERRKNKGTFYNAGGDPDSLITARNSEREKFSNGGINLNFRYKPDSTDRELSMNADYIRYSMGNDQLYKNASFDASSNPKTNDILAGNLPSSINIFSFKTDYVHPLSASLKMETGLKTSYIRTDNDAQYFTTVNNVTLPDYEKTNHFIYDENINAAYINFSKELQRFTLQAGLRAEHTLSKGYQTGNLMKPDSSFRRSYVNVFPTVFALYKLDSTGSSSVSFSYSRRIGRPYYADLNPFISPLDKFTYYAGNPFLQPEFTHHFEVGYNYKNKISTSVFYDHVKDEMNEMIELSGNTFISRTGNIGKKNVAGISADATVNIKKWWTLLPYAEYIYVHTRSKVYTESVNTKAGFWSANITSQFRISKTWSAELFGRYRSDIVDGQFRGVAVSQVNASVQKKIMKDKGSVKLNMVDLFYTRINQGYISSLKNGKGYYHNPNDSRALILAFTYNFSKGAKANTGRNNTGAENETNRVKN